ncbi:MAG: DNA-processing protein DprA [Patescibacteria group bacterium]|nr:DNA-processing protein DprA [Patescibacteria group bacterium]
MPSPIRELGPEEFPKALAEMADPPEKLYLESAWPQDNAVFLTVVGSRKYSHYGREVCEVLIAGLAAYPIVIVSGLALGIDTIAHQAALSAGLTTIAVPGSGLDRSVLHPHSNKHLADEIVEHGGALLSEYSPTKPAGIHTFPRRNRIMAGLSQATLVIEAGLKSGTLITARLALDYNRDVLTVPGSIFSPGSAGTNWLIRQGATPITSSQELLEALSFNTEESGPAKLPLQDLSPDEKKIVDILQIETLPRDNLIRALGLETSTANSLLGILEIKGIVKETGGEIRLN